MKRCLLVILLFFSLPVTSAELEVREGYDRLTDGNDHWRSHVVAFNHQFAPRKTVYGEWEKVERFSLIDQGVVAGFYWPLSSNWTLQLEGKQSELDQYNILPQASQLVRFHRKLPVGWGVALSQRDTEHSISTISNMTLELENYYVRLYSLYRYSSGTVAGAGDTESHSLSMRYLFSAKYYLGFGTGFGTEVEKASPTVILTSTVFHFYLNGLYMLDDKLAFTGVVSLNKQGDLYQREGLQFGIRYRF